MLKFIKDISLKTKLLFSSFVILFFVIITVNSIALYTIYTTLVYRNSLRNNARKKTCVSQLKFFLLHKDIVSIKNVFYEINRDSYIKYLYINVFKDKKIGIKHQLYLGLYNKKLIINITPELIKHDDKVLGKVYVQFNIKKELQHIRLRVFWVAARFYFISFIIIFIGLVIFYFIISKIIEPLILLKNNMAKVSSGDYSVHIEPSSKDEVGSLADIFNSMIKSIKGYTEKIELISKEREELNCMAQMGEMSTMVAHEIKNAAYVINSSNKYIKNNLHTKDKKLIEFINIIEEELKRLNNMTVGFMNFAKQREPKLTDINLNYIINESLQILNYEIKNINIKIIKQLDNSIGLTKGDKELLKQVIINLLINAMDAVSNVKNPTIRITSSAAYKKDKISISISDNGEGIKTLNTSNVFKPFFTTKKSGTGLGLAISSRIVFLHKGSIKAERIDGFTVFTVILPKR
jgi:nitrogen fixation/metabolism regulation signal transduction histidine kinase